MTISNAMTVDVEDYFQVSAFEGTVAKADWDSLPGRIEPNMDRLLTLFERHQVKVTFFTLGWVAERYPAMIRRIVREGHELASHGYDHQRATEQTEALFKQDVSKSKAILEDLAGCEVKGYRAPSFSINTDNLWTHQILADCGYRYSSSIYPVRHDLYGVPQAPRFPFTEKNSGLVEIPVSTLQLCGRNFPCGGGGFFRLLPPAYYRWAIARLNAAGQSALFYLHPWELDPEQPRQQGLPWRSRFRHYLNLDRTEARLDKLLGHFSWDRMDQIFIDADAVAYPVVDLSELCSGAA